MNLLDIMKKRRSHRIFKDDEVDEDKINLILKAALLAPSSKNIRPLEFILVKDNDTLQFLSKCRTHGSSHIINANCAIVVLADTTVADAWIEDASIAMTNMMLMAESLDIGNCWVQIRMRKNDEDKLSSDVIKEALNIPDNYEVESILTLGVKEDVQESRCWDESETDKIHHELF